MSAPARIVYCRCAYCRVLPAETRDGVYAALTASQVHFEQAEDFCELAAAKSQRLREIFDGTAPVRMAACAPRAVRWLLDAGGVPADHAQVAVFDMRRATAEQVVRGLLEGFGGDALTRALGALAAQAAEPSQQAGTPAAKKMPWFPVIDRSRCTNCRKCFGFCLFGVYEIDAQAPAVRVAKPDSCKTNCPACARICSATAIIFPKHPTAPINGDDANANDMAEQNMQTDLSALLKGDAYEVLRNRGAGNATESKDLLRAIEDRRKCTGPNKGTDDRRGPRDTEE